MNNKKSKKLFVVTVSVLMSIVLTITACAKAAYESKAAFSTDRVGVQNGSGPRSSSSKKEAGNASRFESNKSSKQAENLESDASIPRKLIKNAHIRFETEDIENTGHIIDGLVTQYGAYISQEDEHSTTSRIYRNITVKIPKEHFDVFLQALADGVKNIEEKTIDIQDVTEEFVDITARLKVKKETESEYIRLLKQAKNVQDVLDIQHQIQVLRSDIESIEGRLRYLEHAVNFSTLYIKMYQKLKNPAASTSVFAPIGEALKDGAVLFAQVCIVILHGWAFLLCIGVFIFFAIKIRKRRKHKK